METIGTILAIMNFAVIILLIFIFAVLVLTFVFMIVNVILGQVSRKTLHS